LPTRRTVLVGGARHGLGSGRRRRDRLGPRRGLGQRHGLWRRTRSQCLRRDLPQQEHARLEGNLLRSHEIFEPHSLIATIGRPTRDQAKVASIHELDDLAAKDRIWIDEARERAVEEALPEARERPCPGFCIPLANILLVAEENQWEPEPDITIRPIVYTNRLLYELIQSLVHEEEAE
jgi:hypothetical protein